MNSNQEKIIKEMRKFVGRNMKEANDELGVQEPFVGHCKSSIQQLVSKTIGLWLPRNDPNPAKKFQWKQEAVSKLEKENKLRQSPIYGTIEEALAFSIVTKQIETFAGSIIQVMFDKMKVPNAAHWHTAIIINSQNEGDGGFMTWLDVNYKNDFVCREHTITHKTFNDMCICFRLYTIL